VSNIDRLLAWGSSTTGRKLLKFAATSAVSTVISGTLLVVIYGARLITSEVLATLVANLLAMVPAYHLVRRWAWGKRGRSHWRREVAPYVGMSLLGTSFSLIGANIAHHLVHTHHWPHLVNTALVEGTNLGSFAIFWVLKILVFNRIFHVGSTPAIPSGPRHARVR
jgi:putative flippase GtrA